MYLKKLNITFYTQKKKYSLPKKILQIEDQNFD